MNTLSVIDTLRQEIRRSGQVVPRRVPIQPFTFVSSSSEETHFEDVVTVASVLCPELFLADDEILYIQFGTSKIPRPQEDAVFIQFCKEIGMEAPEINKLYFRWLFRSEIPDWLYTYCATIIACKNV